MTVAELTRPCDDMVGEDESLAHLRCEDMPERALCGAPLRVPGIAASTDAGQCVVCAQMWALCH